MGMAGRMCFSCASCAAAVSSQDNWAMPARRIDSLRSTFRARPQEAAGPVSERRQDARGLEGQAAGLQAATARDARARSAAGKDAAEGHDDRQRRSRAVHRGEAALPVDAGAVRHGESVPPQGPRPSRRPRSSTSAATAPSRRTASATATRSPTSTTASGSPGTATSA